MKPWILAMGAGCTLALGTAQGVEWNGSKEWAESIVPTVLPNQTLYADILPDTVYKGKELLRSNVKTTVSKPNAKGKVTDTHTLSTRFFRRSGQLLRKLPDMKIRYTHTAVRGLPRVPSSQTLTGAMGIATGAGKQGLIVRSMLLVGSGTPGGGIQQSLLVEVRDARGGFAKKWSKTFKGNNQLGSILFSGINDIVVTDTDGDGVDELVLVYAKSSGTSLLSPTLANITKTTIQRYNINNGKLIQTLVTTP